jgi:hypothetical protein
LGICASCCLAKSHRLPFISSFTPATQLLELVHCDVWGPSQVISRTVYRYYVLFIDHFLRFNWIYFCSRKSDVADIFLQFKALVENLLSSTIKTVQIDGGTEFQPIIRSHPSIQFHLSCPYIPQQNGLVERKLRYVVELSLAIMFHAHISQTYWSDIFESVIFVVNHLPSSSLSFQPPSQVLFNKNVDYTFFNILGCQCFP